MICQNVRIIGHSQGGTSLFLSILDGTDGILAHPFEPNYERIFDRLKYYDSWEYLLSDYIVGIKDHFHSFFLKPSEIEINDSLKPESLKSLKIKLEKLKLKMKTIDFKIFSLPSSFPQNKFMSAYIKFLLSDLEADKKCTIDNLISTSSSAIQFAFKETGNETSDQDIFVFKHAISLLTRKRIEWFSQEKKNGKTIFLTRNPYARLSSKMDYNDIYHNKIYSNNKKNILNKIRICNYIARDYVRINNLKNSDNFFIISYEELVLNTNFALEKVFNFINLNKSNIDKKEYFMSTLRQKTSLLQNRTDNKSSISKNSLTKWKKKLKFNDKFILSLAIGINYISQFIWKAKV